MKSLVMADRTRPIPVPAEIAVCPICGSAIYIEEVHEWESETGKPIAISAECSTEPDIDSDEWPAWHAHHWRMPYVYWMPVLKTKVLPWLQKNFKCV